MSKTSLGLGENHSVFLCYLFGWLSGLLILLIEKDNNLVRFHAAQSMVLFGGLSIIQVIFGTGFMLGTGLFGLIYLAATILWIYLLVKAWTKEYVELPIIGDIAKNISDKVKL